MFASDAKKNNKKELKHILESSPVSGLRHGVQTLSANQPLAKPGNPFKLSPLLKRRHRLQQGDKLEGKRGFKDGTPNNNNNKNNVVSGHALSTEAAGLLRLENTELELSANRTPV